MHDTVVLRTVCLTDPVIRRYFLDVYVADQVPCIPANTDFPCCAIVNTDPISHPGQHWVALYWDSPVTGEFFDSYAERPSTLVARWRCFDHFSPTVPHALQAWSSDVCGDYCLYYLYKRCRGVSKKDIASNFHLRDLRYNDQRLNEEPHRNTLRQYCISRSQHKVYQ